MESDRLRVTARRCQQPILGGSAGAFRARGGDRVTYQWVDCERAFIERRYDRIASLIALFDWLLFVPPQLRRRAAIRLGLRPGDRVLELGCGTGRNFPYLRREVGRSGMVYGVDLSAGMLQRAQDLCDRERWANVELTQCDAEYIAPEPLDGILFGLSYNTMPHHLAVLKNAWKQLRPGGRVVIVDAKLPPGLGGDLVLPFSVWLMKRTLLGNPYIKPWKDLAEITDDFAMEEFLFGSYYVARGTKPERADQDLDQAELRLIAAE
jgi:demethylmenaquinone methyltransferase/2-methoxy-6-polyprenyl-1,4-benzoquinol methylase